MDLLPSFSLQPKRLETAIKPKALSFLSCPDLSSHFADLGASKSVQQPHNLQVKSQDRDVIGQTETTFNYIFNNMTNEASQRENVSV